MITCDVCKNEVALTDVTTLIERYQRKGVKEVCPDCCAMISKHAVKVRSKWSNLADKNLQEWWDNYLKEE